MGEVADNSLVRVTQQTLAWFIIAACALVCFGAHAIPSSGSDAAVLPSGDGNLVGWITSDSHPLQSHARKCNRYSITPTVRRVATTHWQWSHASRDWDILSRCVIALWQGCRFMAAETDGRPVAAWVGVPMSFVLSKS